MNIAASIQLHRLLNAAACVADDSESHASYWSAFRARSRVADLLTAQAGMVMYGFKASLVFEMGLRQIKHALFSARKLPEVLLPMLGQRLQITKFWQRFTCGGLTLAQG